MRKPCLEHLYVAHTGSVQPPLAKVARELHILIEQVCMTGSIRVVRDAAQGLGKLCIRLGLQEEFVQHIVFTP